jgi:hypothetical protein
LPLANPARRASGCGSTPTIRQIYVTAESLKPFTVTASIENWRTNRQEVTELQTSDVMTNRKVSDPSQVQTITEPDTVLKTNSAALGGFITT